MFIRPAPCPNQPARMESRDPRLVPPADYLHEEAEPSPEADPGRTERSEAAWFADPVQHVEEGSESSHPTLGQEPEPEHGYAAAELPASPAWSWQEETPAVEQEPVPAAPPVVLFPPSPGSIAAFEEPPATVSTSRQASPRKARDKAAQLGLGTREKAGAIAGARHANLRRTPHLAKLVVITFLANAALLAGAGWWFQQKMHADMEARLAGAGDGTGIVPEDGEITVAGLAAGDLRSKGQLAEALKRLDEMAADLSAVQGALLEKQGTQASGTSSTATASTPFQSEILFLRERNRLTSWADEAIATGSRAAYDRLCEILDDPRKVKLTHAAQAEILRVHNFYQNGSRIERFDIPVATYFPDEALLKDSQLKDDQIIFLLQKRTHPWQVRLKAANLLSPRRSLLVGDALVKAVLEDDNLDVVKEAALSFEQLTGHHARIFDAEAIAKWWKTYRETPPPPKVKAAPTAVPSAVPAAPAKAKAPASGLKP